MREESVPPDHSKSAESQDSETKRGALIWLRGCFITPHENRSAILESDVLSRTIFNRLRPCTPALIMAILGGIAFAWSKASHFDSIPLGNEHVGYVDRGNWGYAYITWIPALLWICGAAHKRLASTLDALRKFGVIVPRITPRPEKDFSEHFNTRANDLGVTSLPLRRLLVF